MTKKKDTQNEEPESPQEITEGSDDGSEDAPELGISVGVENGNVIILFSQRLTTVGMPPDAADKMGDALKEHAASARKMRDN